MSVFDILNLILGQLWVENLLSDLLVDRGS